MSDTVDSIPHAMVEMYSLHGELIKVDEGMVDVISWCITNHWETQYSCQGGPEYFEKIESPNWAYIMFSTPEAMVEFVETVAHLMAANGYFDVLQRMRQTSLFDEDVVHGKDLYRWRYEIDTTWETKIAPLDTLSSFKLRGAVYFNYQDLEILTSLLQ